MATVKVDFDGIHFPTYSSPQEAIHAARKHPRAASSKYDSNRISGYRFIGFSAEHDRIALHLTEGTILEIFASDRNVEWTIMQPTATQQGIKHSFEDIIVWPNGSQDIWNPSLIFLQRLNCTIRKLDAGEAYVNVDFGDYGVIRICRLHDIDRDRMVLFASELVPSIVSSSQVGDDPK
jgi:hypothetical protein